MGLADDLGYHHDSTNPLQRGIQRFASTRPGAWSLARILPPLDTWVQKRTDGRHSAPGLLVGLSVLELTSTGRKSGLPRTAHLIAIPFHGTLALIGTNFGQSATPTWVLNLEANPRAQVHYRGTTLPVVARLADEQEHEEVLARSENVYLGYRKYQTRIAHRRLRIFVLERAG